MIAFLDLMPLAGWCTLTEEEREYLYLNVEKTWYYDCRVVAKERVESQKRKRLARKREAKDEKEIADSSKRTQHAIFEAVPMYESMAALEDELQSFHPAARDTEPRPKYSTALKTAIVREQLNIRKWVYGRKFKEGFLDSATNDGNAEKLANLKKTLRTILNEEAKSPPVKTPPLMRSEYELGPNSTPFRRSLDAERNHKTRELEAEFVKNHPGRIFAGKSPLY